jgi:hypothetical protein
VRCKKKDSIRSSKHKDDSEVAGALVDHDTADLFRRKKKREV